MQDKYKELQELSEDIFNLTVLLRKYCSQNSSTQEMNCIHTFSKVVSAKTDTLTFKVEELAKEILTNKEDPTAKI